MRISGSWVVVLACVVARPAWAGGTIMTGSGEVEQLFDAAHMGPLLGTADFEGGPVGAPIPLDAYAAQGMMLHTGPLVDILPGATTPGSASAPVYGEGGEPFAGQVWGGTAVGMYARGGVVATFDAPITQIGVLAGREGPQILTVWDKQGEVIAEILWTPSGDAWFLGIDTVGRPIGMVAFGDDSLISSEPDTYTPLAEGVASDTWVWSLGRLCEVDADCDDASVCTGVETCKAGYCALGVPIVCEDDDACTVNGCHPVNGCEVQAINNCCHTDADCPQAGTICEDTVCVAAPLGTSGDEGSSGADTSTATTEAVSAGSSGGDDAGPTSGAGEVDSGGDGSSDGGDATSPTTNGGGEAASGEAGASTTAGTGTAGEAGSGSLPGETAVDDGCACAHGRGGEGLLGGLGVLLLRRRRKSARIGVAPRD